MAFVTNRECNECGSVAKPGVRRCANCGASNFSTVREEEQKPRMTDEEARARRSKDEAEHTKKCNQWLIDKGIITADMSTPERMKALAKYRNKITKTPKVPSKQWAKDLISHQEDGENLPHGVEEFARQALGSRHSHSSDDVEIDLDDIEIEF